MSKLNSGLNKDTKLNSRIKPKINEKNTKKVRKLLSLLTEMDIKTSKLCNVIVIKNEENENKKLIPPVIPQRYYREDLERMNQNAINIENEINSDSPEMANSSDFENDDDEF